jgi:dTDP-4-dehydrorhamnose reductase
LVHSLECVEKRLIIVGSGGFIGSHFCRACPAALAIGRSQLDLAKPEITFPTEGYRYAIIAAGISNPKRCETDPEGTYRCNVEGTLRLGKELLKRGITPIFFSTDYVFDDTLKRAPMNEYGKQKLELEEQASRLGALTIRLSKVYGIEKGDQTLFDEMAAKLKGGKAILAARDQIFAPVFVGDVISQTLSCAQGKRGVVSVVGPRYASRLEMAKKMGERLGVKEELIQEIGLDDLRDGVQRPKFLKLSSSIPSLSWEEGIEQVVKAYAQ